MTGADDVPTARSRTVAALFVVYLVLLVWGVLWKLETPWVGDAGQRIIKVVPFVAAGRSGASTPFDVVANLLLFVPFGLYLGLLAPARSWRTAAGTVAAASLALEVAEYALAVGSTDVTDVVVNTAGGLLGLGLLALVRSRLQGRTAPVMARACVAGTFVAVVAVAVVVASPLRYGPPQDVTCVSGVETHTRPACSPEPGRLGPMASPWSP